MTNATTNFAFVNNTGSSTAYAYVTGNDLNNNNALAMIQTDGKTVYYPASPSGTNQPLAVDCAIPLGDPGTTTNVTIPQLGGARIWFVVDSKLTFLLNPGPGLVEPSVTNTTDPNYNLKWDFCEFTYNSTQLFANITYVDFVCLPIALQLTNTSGAVQTVEGLPTDGLDQICTQLKQQASSENSDWTKLIVTAPDGSNLRALSANSGSIVDSTFLSGYYESYVNSAWAKYASTALEVDTQAQWGTVSGTTTANANTLSFGTNLTFAKPATADVFSCSTGPFANYPAATSDEMGAIGARLAAALNRSTLLTDPDQPDGETNPASFYQTSPTNHYARICHSVNIDGRGYAFPYDDVAPSSETAPDQAGTVSDGSPQLLTVTVGGPPSSAGPATGGNKKETDDGKKSGAKTGTMAGMLQKVKTLFTGCFGSRK
ncbi:glucanase B [Xylariaceae sp. FL0255]|nr:glucanase B [Xylariaceae sp. FL0255]